MNSKGFSLLELLIVIGMLGILAAIAAPTTKGWIANTERKEASRQVCSALLEARSLAVSENLEHRAVFTLVGYQIQRNDAGSWVEVKAGEFAENIKIRTGASCDQTSTLNIGFRPNGASPDPDSYVCIMDGNEKKLRSGVLPGVTGRVVIQKWNGSAWK